MEIIPMTAEHISEVEKIDTCSFDIPWPQNAFTDELNNKIAIYYVAKRNGVCIGYCGFWNVAGEGDITNIAVLPEYRNMGVASALMEKILKEAQSLGLSMLTLEVRSSNKAAQALYSKYGFERIGTRKRYYSDNHEDAWIMTKELT